jgi:putative DNA primase/helicase
MSLNDNVNRAAERLEKTRNELGVRRKKHAHGDTNNPTLPAHPAFPRTATYTDHEKSYTDELNPTQTARGAFTWENENGAKKLIIESDTARALATGLRNRFAYNVEAATWHRFTSTHWASCSSSADADRRILAELYIGTDPIGFKAGYFNGVVSIMLKADMLPLPPPPAGKIPFRNGLLNIITRVLEPVTPLNAATWCIPHNYTPGTDCPVFMAWLESATGQDAGLIQLLRAFIAACLTGRADLQKFLHLLGPGGTGKSTFIRLLFAMLGPANCVTTDLRQLEQNRFETASLYGKRLAAITDSDRYGGAVNVLKALTGQDPVRNERKNVQQTGTFIFEGMVIVASNEPLQSTDYTSGLERRRLVIKFDRRIPPEEKAAFLAAGGEERLHREIPAIINWALELSSTEVTNLFMHPPQSAADAAFDSLTAQNPIAEWIAESLIPAPGHWSLVGVKNEKRTPDGAILYEDADSKLYPNYLRWCAQNRRECLALRRFRHAMVDMIRTMGADVIEARRASGQGLTGVRIRAEFEAPHPWSRASAGKSYTPTPASVERNAPEAAPVQAVKDMQDFCPSPSQKIFDDSGRL